MSKKLLEQRLGQTITDAEFKIIMEIATDDIKFNRIGFKKYTSLNYVLDIAAKSASIFKRCA
ncbi:hypothetical protein [Clostridium tagluense]|uniref:Uncharacterized protein n=1 Tax=Clostridium tagluense TaxID=360422 RepID=A0A401UUF6_9CLOT|nr:hypothetical protein [Clostridium tagluense]GCD13171.1 hypothetical protein Ctaglu_47940 [Clostridium tagluense]